jgi:hypothetical protein
MGCVTELRLLPWLSADGKPCFLAPGDGGGIVSRLADETEARQLAVGRDVLGSARKVLENPLSSKRRGAVRRDPAV